MFDPSKSLKKMLGKGLQVPRMMTGTKSPSDWDGDGILNKFDCQPRNLIRQDNITSESMMGYDAKKDKKLPTDGFCDPGIYNFITRINNAGFITFESCSGLKEDHSGQKNVRGFLGIKNKINNILDINKGTKWASMLSSKIDDNHGYLTPYNYKHYMFRNGVSKGKLLPLFKIPDKPCCIVFMLPNLSDAEILIQWELLTRKIESVR